MKKIKDLLVLDIVRPARPAIPKSMKVWKAWRIMKSHSEFFLPVEDNGSICGVVGFRDLQLASNLSGNERSEVYEVMDIHILRVLPTESVLSVVQKMFNENIICALAEEDGKVVGMINCFDAMKLLVDDNGHPVSFGRVGDKKAN